VSHHFSQIFSEHWVSDVRQTEIHTAEPLLPEPGAFEVEMVIKKQKKTHVALMVERRGAYRVLVGKPEEQRPRGRPRRRWRIILRWIFKQ
jgi:hypothetical protein